MLKKETVDMMFTPQLAEGTSAHSALIEKDRLMVGETPRGLNISFGLEWASKSSVGRKSGKGPRTDVCNTDSSLGR